MLSITNPQEQFQREDTAVQRRAADLEAAGLSKTLAAGSAASSTPIQARSTQTKAGLPAAVLANAQKELTSAKITESKTQSDLNRQNANYARQNAMYMAQKTINEGIQGQGYLNANVLSGDKARSIPLEREAFNQLGWSYYKDAPGYSGEIARALASFATATTGLTRTVMAKLQPLVDKIAASPWINQEERQRMVQEGLDKVRDLPGKARDGIERILNGQGGNLSPGEVMQYQNNDRVRNSLPYY